MPFYTTGYDTQTAGTEIVSVCPPNGDLVPVVRGFKVRNGSTLNNVYSLSPLGATTTVEFRSATSTTLELARNDPGRATNGLDSDLAVDDWIAYETQFGNIEARKISAITDTTVTIAATGSDVNVGARVWAFYSLSDAGAVFFDIAASAEVLYENLHVQCGVPVQRGIQAPVSGIGQPMLVLFTNETNAGKMDFVSYEWVDKSHDFIS